MLRTVFLTSLVALLAVIYLYLDRDTLSLKFFSGQKTTVQGQSATSHVSSTSYASTPPVKPSEAYSASYQDYLDPRTQARHRPVESAPSDQPSPDGQQPLLPGPDEIPAGDAALLSEEAQLERLGPIVVNSDGTLSRISNWQGMTEAEKALTLKRLRKRNEQRLKQLKEQMNTEGLDTQD